MRRVVHTLIFSDFICQKYTSSSSLFGGSTPGFGGSTPRVWWIDTQKTARQPAAQGRQRRDAASGAMSPPTPSPSEQAAAEPSSASPLATRCQRMPGFGRSTPGFGGSIQGGDTTRDYSTKQAASGTEPSAASPPATRCQRMPGFCGSTQGFVGAGFDSTPVFWWINTRVWWISTSLLWINTQCLVDQHQGLVDQHQALVDQHPGFGGSTTGVGGSTLCFCVSTPGCC